MIPLPRPVPPPKIKRESSQNWMEGLITNYADGRLPSGGLTRADNVEITQNGVLENVPGEKLVFSALGEIQGEVFQAKRLDGSLYLIFAYNAGDGTATVAKYEINTITDISTGHGLGWYHFVQVADKVLIMNDGMDNLCYYDQSENEVINWTPIDDPTAAPTLAASSTITGANTVQRLQYVYTYQNTGGETLPSPVAAVNVTKLRSQWGAGDSVTITRPTTTDPDATSWNVYISFTDDEAADIPVEEMVLMAANLSIESTQWADDGTSIAQAQISTPKDNSTGGIPAWTGEVINGRPWLIGKYDNKYRIYRGGDVGFEVDFSRRNGGGWQDINSGTEYVPQFIGGFRDGQGNMVITVLSDGVGGLGRRNNLSMRQITVGNSQIVVWESIQQSGRDGTSSPYGVASYNNALFYPSKDGFKTTATREQLQNVLSTDRITEKIKDKALFLKDEFHHRITHATVNDSIYWNVPYANSIPNQIWCYSADHGGAWTILSPIQANSLTQYRTRDSINSLAFTRGDSFYVLDDQYIRPASAIQSGLNKISEDAQIWARLIQVPFILLLLEGDVEVGVIAHTEDGNKEFSRTIHGYQAAPAPMQPIYGWSHPISWGLMNWGAGIRSNPRVSGWREFIVEVDEDVNFWQYYIKTEAGRNRYQLSQVTGQFVEIGLYNLTN